MKVHSKEGHRVWLCVRALCCCTVVYCVGDVGDVINDHAFTTGWSNMHKGVGECRGVELAIETGTSVLRQLHPFSCGYKTP